MLREMCTRNEEELSYDGGEVSRMNVFQIFSFTIFLLCYFLFLLNFYSDFPSRFFNDNPILLVVDDL